MPRFMNQQIKTMLVSLPMFNDFFPFSASSHSGRKYSHKVIAESDAAFFFFFFKEKKQAPLRNIPTECNTGKLTHLNY